ncbi:hypothetical protein GTY75_08835 [Streptomyces sp. SID8381]|uniref:DUF6082 family protein n=1 Tax=unclassified Streptomyces TaxID=2593676 RepID=UPI00036CE64F|nr:MULTISPECIES: DUF6082 family protein [unclassified Streptomyces]MYX26774.1 hypothetical protein [Streptomyces sp. SID8381]
MSSTRSRTACAVLVVAAVHAAGIALAERHRRRELTVAMEPMHQAYIARLVDQPDLLADQKPTDMPDEDFRRAVHANMVVSLLHVKFRAGLLDADTLRTRARAALRRQGVRLYWQHFGSLRAAEAKDHLDRTFSTIFDDEFANCQAPERAPAGTAA